MPDKGKIMSQTFFDKQSELLQLYQEALAKKEMTVNEAVIALRMLGFSESIATYRANEWGIQICPDESKSMVRRNKRQASLENFMHRMRLGKKYKEESKRLRSKYVK